jgi:antitoxin component YwqK of YwqJK toxin-antitoxin module
MLAYKAAENNETRVLITLEIPEDALTNIARSSALVKEKAKHRTNKVKVLKIEDSQGKEYQEAQTSFFYDKKLIYRVGEILEEPAYDTNPENVCSQGIHFFLEKKVAEQFELDEIQDGILERYYHNGRKQRSVPFKNGKKHGLKVSYYETGQKMLEVPYSNGLLHGVSQSWYVDGRQWGVFEYRDGNSVCEENYQK